MGNKLCGSKGSQAEFAEELQPMQHNEAKPAVAPDEKLKMGSLIEQREEDLHADELAAFHRPHRCTDVFCSLVFVLAVAGACHIMGYAAQHGDISKLTHGLDWKGDLCGIDAEVKERPFLYWCTKGGNALSQQDLINAGIQAYLETKGEKIGLIGIYAVMGKSETLDLAHPICVHTCPTDSSSQHPCFQNEQQKVSDPLVTGSFTRNITYNFSFVQDYPTYTVARRYCIPVEVKLVDQLVGTLNWGVEAAIFRVAQLKSSWQPILVSAAVAVGVGYAYIILAKFLAPIVVWVAIAVATILPLCAGLYGLYGSFRQAIDQVFEVHLDAYLQKQHNMTVNDLNVYVPSTGDRAADIAISSLLCAIGALMAIAACSLRKKVSLVLGALEASFDCIWDMPSMLAFPIVTVAPVLSYVACALYGFAYLLTVGAVQKYDVDEYVPNGFARTFSFTPDEQVFLMFYTFTAIWGLELLLSFDQFNLGYATQRWYFKEYQDGHKDVPGTVFLRGAFLAVVYHLGSLALGSFLISLFRVLNWLLSFAYNRVRGSTSDPNVQSAAKAAVACCCCCFTCWEKLARFVNKDAYVVVGIRSIPFCEAAEEALGIVMSEVAAAATLKGATIIFQLAGLVSITSGGTYLTWLLCRTVPIWKDPTSEYFVSSPETVCIVAGMISFVIALCFTIVFDLVCDTMLFCYALDVQMRGGKASAESDRYMPPRFKALLESQQ